MGKNRQLGASRKYIREDFAEEVISKLRCEAGVGVTWTMGREAKASSKELSRLWEGVWNFIECNATD